VRQHVAPMAGRVANAQVYWLILGSRLGKRFFAPRVPIDGIVCVLHEVRTRFVDKAIGELDWFAILRHVTPLPDPASAWILCSSGED